MKPEDFYKLTINQEVWHKDNKKHILWLDGNGTNQLFRFKEDTDCLYWGEVCEECSLKPPQEKRKVYQHFYTVKGQEDLVCVAHSFCAWEKVQAVFSARTLLKTIELFECE